MGIENELDEDEIAEADCAILAIDVGIEGDERFDEKRDEEKCLTVGFADAISRPGDVIDEALAL